MPGKSSSDGSIYVLLTSPVTMATLQPSECTCCISLEERDEREKSNITIPCGAFSWENVCDWKMSTQLQTTIFYTEPKGKSTGRNKENMFFPRSLEGTLGIKWLYKQLRHYLQLHLYHVRFYYMYLKQTLNWSIIFRQTHLIKNVIFLLSLISVLLYSFMSLCHLEIHSLFLTNLENLNPENLKLSFLLIKVHGSVGEPWWIWVEDPTNDHIYHSEYFIIQKKQVMDFIQNLTAKQKQS